ncbi:MAG: copper-binding protein [Alphaproteobacteria bacterium]|nr:copper-binding protein [Alphaproteobacteria bacterium]
MKIGKFLRAGMLALALAGAASWAHGSSSVALAQSADASLVNGDVRKVDKETGRVTIRHDPIPSLEMPAMTMVFRVIDSAMLDRLKAGDKIRFAVDKVGGNYTVMRYEPVPR